MNVQTPDNELTSNQQKRIKLHNLSTVKHFYKQIKDKISNFIIRTFP